MRKEKQLLLDEIKEGVVSSSAFLIAEYRAMGPNLAHELRVQLRGAGSRLFVVKKRLFLKAVQELGLGISLSTLSGHVGVILASEGDDLLAVKKVYQFRRTYRENLEVLGGYFQNKLYTPSECEEVAKLPDLKQMRAQLVGLLQAPMVQTLATMESLLLAPILCIEQRMVKEEKEGQA